MTETEGDRGATPRAKEESRLMKLFGRLLDPTKGHDLPLKQFPEMYAMESHTGGFGAAFTGLWLSLNYADLLSEATLAFWFIVAALASFVALLWVSGHMTKKVVDWANDVHVSLETLHRRKLLARLGIAGLSSAYVLTCGMLIAFTGGPRSAFAPFYVMIFVLTARRLRFPYPALPVFCYFAGIMIVSFLLSRYNLLISKQAMDRILQSDSQTGIAGFFFLLALVVPIASMYFVYQKEKTLQQRSPSSTPGDSNAVG
jgi:hypothetical protein